MVDIIRKLRSSDEGLSLVELAIGAVVTSLLAAVLFAMLSGALRFESNSRSEDSAMQDLRFAKGEFTKEVRRAEYLTTAEADQLVAWIDFDSDGAVGADETVTWQITAGGDLVRSVSAVGSRTIMKNLNVAASSFSYDSATPANVRRIQIALVAQVEQTNGTIQRGITTELSLRNGATP